MQQINQKTFEMPSARVIACSKIIAKRQFTIAFVESATAGKLCYEFSQTTDAGKIFRGGLICYDARLKEDILSVPRLLIEKYTPESAEVTAALAKRLPDLISCDIAVAATGLTSDGGSETPDKPVGTMFVHIVLKNNSQGYRKVFTGPPDEIVTQTIDYTAMLVSAMLQEGARQ